MTVTLVTLRPTGTVKQVGVATTSSVAAHTVLSDNSDGTRAQGTVQNGVLILDMGTTTLGALRVYEAQVKVRDAHDTVGAGIQKGWARFRDPLDGQVNGQMDLARGGTDVQYQYGPRVSAAPGGRAWTQTVLSRMQVEIAWKTSDDGNYLGVQELYIDLWTYAQPSVATVVVTGAASTTRPTITFNYTGDATQSRFRVYVYSAAQYGAAGFVAGSSPAAWDSGDQFGSQETIDVAVDLANNATYKAYVKGAYDWPGPEGELWWSALAVSSTFTIAVVPPPAPTLTATPELTLPSYRVRLAVTTAVNLLTADEANFEAGIGGWSAESNCTVAASGTNPAQGTQCLAITATAGGDAIARSGTFGTSHRVKPGAQYTALVSFRSAVTSRSVNAGIKWYDAAGGVISLVYGANATDTTGGYTQASATLTAPANAFSAHVLAKVQAAAAAEVHRADKIDVHSGSSTTWTDGGYSQTGSVLIERTQRISPAIGRGPARNWLHPQIHSAGALTTASDGFYPRSATDSITARILDTAPPEAPGNVSAGMVEWDIRTGGTYLDLGAQDGVATDGMHPYLSPAVAGKDMTYSVWLKASAAITVRLGLYYVDSVNTSVDLTFSSTLALTTSWQKLSVSDIAPAGTVYARAVIENNSATADRTVRLTQPTFRPSSEPAESWPGQVWSFEWETVRSSPLIPQDGSDPVCYDHEAPPGRPVIYRATVIGANSTGQSMASLPSPQVAVYMDPPAQPLLKDPFQPENAVVVMRSPDSISRSEDAEIFHPIGRDADPVKITSWRGGDDGKLHIETVGSLELYRLRQLVGSTRPLLLQHHDGGQTYLLLSPAGIEELSPSTPFHAVEASYVECKRPA